MEKKNRTMKKLLTITFALIALQSFGQEWCNAGANWKYSYMSGFGTEGYVEINYGYDTLIDGENAQVLLKNLYAYDYIMNQPINYLMGKEYTYHDNGIVFLRYNDSWDTLYNFNANVGESWRMAKQPFSNACDSNSILNVIATGTKTINSEILRYKVVEFEYGGIFSNGTTDTIVEKIGFINNYMFPYEMCNSTLDLIEGGPFRCYSDDQFATYQPHFIGLCDYVGMNNLLDHPAFTIAPNPVQNTLKITSLNEQEIATISIYNLSNQLVFFSEFQNEINITDLPTGFYLLTADTGDFQHYFRFVKE